MGRRRWGAAGRRWLSVLALLSALLVPGRASAEPRGTFIAENRCQIVVRLNAIHAQRGAPDRFLVAAARGRGQAYVQCLLVDEDTNLLCEASSGYYAAKEGAPRVVPPAPPAALAHLRAAQFEGDGNDGNFQRMIALKYPSSDFQMVADLLLGLLFDVYGVTRSADLRYTAPLAPGRVRIAPDGCQPAMSLAPEPPRPDGGAETPARL